MKAGKGYLILLTAVFLCAAAVWMSRDAVETVSEKNETESAEELAPRVAISFDDGPHKTYTPLLLDGLKERDVKATFFLIGKIFPARRRSSGAWQRKGISSEIIPTAM